MGQVGKGSSTFRQINLAFFAAGFVTFVSLYDVQPLLPVFAHEFGVPAAISSLPLSLTTCALAISMLIVGSLSEVWGRKPIMITSLFLSSVLAILIAFSHTFHALLELRLLQGIFLAGLPAIAMAYLSEEIEPSSLGAAMGLYISGNAIGGMTGRIYTASMTDLFSWRLAVGSIGVLCLLLSIYFTRSLPPSTNFRRRSCALRPLVSSFFRQLREPGLLSLYGTGFMVMGSFVTLYNYITFRLLEAPYNLSQTLICWIFLVYLLGSGSSTLMGNLSGRFGRNRILCISLAAMLLGLAITLLSSLPFVIAGIAIFTSGFFGAHSVASSWVGGRARGARAQASSLYLFFYYLGSSLSGTAGGFFWTSLGWAGIAGLIAMLILLAFCLAYRLSLLTETEAVAGQQNVKLPVSGGGSPSPANSRF